MANEIDGGIMSSLVMGDNFFGERYRVFLPDQQNFSTENESLTIDPADTNCFYSMRSFPRGKLVILNMKTFTYSSGLQNFERFGTEKDAEALSNLFVDYFGFVVELYEDLTKDELLNVLRRKSKDSYTDYSTLCIALLTHGREKVIYATDDCIEIRKITRMFTGPNLAGKPKLFLIQACQGSDYMEGLDVIDSPSSHDGKKRPNKLSLPIEADFLYAYSTTAGFYSWRNGKTGSWFIQTLCEVFRKHAHDTDIVRMLTKVNRIISQRKSQSTTTQANSKRQVSSTVSQLRKEFYFFPSEVRTESENSM